MALKFHNSFLIYVKFRSSHSPIRIASSAYRRWDINGPLFGALKPANSFSSHILFMKHENTSMPIMNKNGDNGSPWRTPLWHWNSKVGEPFTNTEDLEARNMEIIQCRHFGEMFIWSKVESIKFQLMFSNAFSKSILKNMSCFFFFLHQE